MSKKTAGPTAILSATASNDRGRVSREMLLVAAATREQLVRATELLGRADGNIRCLGLAGAGVRTQEAITAARRALALVEITLKRIP